MAGNPFTSAQAPAAMQMLAPDLAAQQMQLARQQQMAEALRQQAMTPLGGTDVVNGWAVKKSPWEAVAKLGQALAGSTMQRTVDDKQLALAKAMQGRYADILGGGSGAPAQPPSTISDAGQPAPAADGAQTLPVSPPDGSQSPSTQPAQAPPAQPQPVTQNNFNMANLLKGQAIASLGGEQAGSAFWDQFKSTDGMRNDKYLGITPEQSRASELAKRLKDGTQSLQPGQTNILPNGQRVVAPNFESGIAGGFDAQGNPVANEIPGSTAIVANRAGAVAGANAQHKLITVNTAGGPVMMTEAQAAQMSGGGTPQAGTHFDNPNGASLNFKGNPQATFDQLSKLPPGPDRDQAMAAFSQYANQAPGGAAPAGAPGIKLRSPEQEAQLMADVKLRSEPQIAQKTKEYGDMADYGKTLDGHVSESQALLQRIAESREALTKFKAGGGADSRTRLASMAQAIPGVSPELVNKIAGGDLGAAQVFQKFAAQEALGTMQQALASDSGKGAQGNRISMELFIKNNPNIDTDPNAIEKVFNFITKQSQQVRAQQEAYHSYKNDPKNDPSAFPAYWAGEAIKRGYVTPQIVTGEAKGSKPNPANVQALLDKYK